MRAYQLVEPGRAELRSVAAPEAGPGEALLRVTGAGVCHSDLHLVHAPTAPFRLPMTLGHEIAGVVEALGPDAAGWETGETALVNVCWGCGRCRACARGADNYCEAHPRGTVPGPGIGRQGGMAERVRVPVRHLARLGDLDPVAAAPLVDAGVTSYHAIDLSADRLGPGATAVVVGVGGLGHMAVQILTATGATTVIAVDRDESRLQQAQALGAAHAVPAGPGAAEAVLVLTRGRGADVVLDFVGAEATLALAAACVASAGQITVVGLGGGRLAFGAAPPPVALPWGVAVVKPYGGTRSDLVHVLALAEAGAVAVHAQPYPLDEAPDVLAALEAGRIDGRAVLVP